MGLRWNSFPILIAFATVCTGTSASQQSPSQKRVAQIKAEQTPAVLAASPLCQWAQQQINKGGPLATLPDKRPILYQDLNYAHDSDSHDLKSLFDASDDVVLVIRGSSTGAVAPSGASAITYYDAQVLRSWKGEHKAGDILTFSIPVGHVTCPAGHTFTSDPSYEWNGNGLALNILFLRHANAAEAGITPDLRLTGGYGQQGMIGIFLVKGQTPEPWACITPALSKKTMAQDIGLCTAFLDASNDPVLFQSPRDPLAGQYDKMPVSTFLREVQSLAGPVASNSNSDDQR
jgi:hypothetical protein